MLARIRKSLENREEGFTLIELLVVMVIIGILAAIAIPSFLAQRDKAYQSAIKNDLKTAQTAEEAYATDSNGVYTDDNAVLIANGLKTSDGVTLAVTLQTTLTTHDTYCISGTSSHTSSTNVFVVSSSDGIVKKGTCPATS